MSYKVTEDNKSNLTSVTSRIDPELEIKVTKATRRICENLHIIANEPSLALYRISEHVRKALPPTVESRCEVKRLHAQLTGAHTDAEYGIDHVKAMEESLPIFGNIEALLHKSLTLQQQINHAPQKRVKRGGAGSIYQRFSAHLASVDIPDLTDFRESARETAQRVESAINKDKNTHQACTRSKSELTESSIGARRRSTWGTGSRASLHQNPTDTSDSTTSDSQQEDKPLTAQQPALISAAADKSELISAPAGKNQLGTISSCSQDEAINKS